MKKNNQKVISEKMERTFAYHRLEVIKHIPTVQDFMERRLDLLCEARVSLPPS